MRYRVSVSGRQLELDLSGEEIRVDGMAVDAVFLPEGSNTGSLRIGHRVFRIAFEPRDGAGVRTPGRTSSTIWVNGERFDVETMDDLALRLEKLAVSAGPRHVASSVRAPMPGLVRAVLVSEGDVVKAGQGVVVMEAMKMENELRAPAAGTVRRILVEPGRPVEKGATLLELDT